MASTADSLKRKVIEFFAQNPDEYLLVDDVMIKWPRSRSKVITTLNDLAKSGLIGRYREKTQSQGRRWVYTAHHKFGVIHHAK